MPSEKCNSTMAKATSVTFSLFNVALAQEVPFGHTVVHTMHSLCSILFCIPLIFAASNKNVNLMMVFFVTEFVLIKQLCNRLTMKHNGYFIF